MSKAGSRNALITSALVVLGIRMWMQLRGKTKTPFAEWAIGYGALFFILSLISEASPSAAGSLSMLVVASDFLVNGVSLTTDVSKAITNAEKGGPTFTDQPFATQASSSSASGGVTSAPPPIVGQAPKGWMPTHPIGKFNPSAI